MLGEDPSRPTTKMRWQDCPSFLAGPLLFNKPIIYTGTALT